jgi:KDO2-lipid IV(A) lauroyltransferase
MSSRLTGLRHLVEIGALRLLSLSVRVLPRRLALAFGAFLGRFAWLLGIRRKVVMANLAQALPEAAVAKRFSVGRDAAASVGRTFVEFLRLSGGDRARVLDLVRVDGLAALRQAVGGGEGVLVVTAHLGSWAMYVAALDAVGISSALLVGQQTNPHVDRLILGIPGESVRFISKGGGAPRQVLECLREGRAVIMVADHYISSEALWAPFLGRSASTLPLPGALIAKRRRPLFLMCGTRAADGVHDIVLREIPVPVDLEGDALRLEVATRINHELGREILAHPEQYWWYHKRWKVKGIYKIRTHLIGTPPGID